MVLPWGPMRNLVGSALLLVLVACGGGAADGGGAKSTDSVALPPASASAAATAPATVAAPQHPNDAPDDGVCSVKPAASAGCADPLADPHGNVGAGMSIQGRLPPEVIARVVRARIGTFRACYEDGLKRAPSLRGTVKVKFTIGPDGSVRSADDAGSQIASPDVVDCVRGAFRKLTFPQPEGGTVTVVYPLVFEPG